jgi:hypothetical protein
MSDIEFVEGLNAKSPGDKAPEYVKAKLSMKREALIAWLQQREGEWVNAEIKVSKSGKWYVAVDAWKPNSDGQSDLPSPRRESKPAHADASNGFVDDSIPF